MGTPFNKELSSPPAGTPPRKPLSGAPQGEERPRLVLFVTNGRPGEERDLILNGVDDVADNGEDEKEEDDDDGYDDVALDHFSVGRRLKKLGEVDAVLVLVLTLKLMLLLQFLPCKVAGNC